MLPEVRLAQRLVERHMLRPQIDVDNLLQDYAGVEYVDFPVKIDGLCLDLKVTGKKPTVLVNRESYPTRRRFTLAHELGHVLIPWHLGCVIGEIDVSDISGDSYYQMASEANRFASELLMPKNWGG
jgi:Zn-dependent peptidase ImmA (M78 family)